MKPVIDVHSHIFSAKDIPVRGYLRSRKSKQFAERAVGPALIPAISECIRKPDSEQKYMKCRMALGLLHLIMGRHYHGWATTLSKEIPHIVKELFDTYDHAGIDLYVPLMIDFEYWFENTVDTTIRDQIEYIADRIIPEYGGRIHPFVPFDPIRELAFRKGMNNPDGEPEAFGSLNLLKAAIEYQGFLGVKIYNSLGYRPIGNKWVDDERRAIFRKTGNLIYGIFTGDEIDDVLLELYQYCEENGIPITAHCVMDGIEAYPKASYVFCRPEFWCDVLNHFGDLRVNLAHFGWNQTKGQGYQGDDSWVKIICQMITLYDNLYADVSHHRVTQRDKQVMFRTGYQDMRKDFDAGSHWGKIKKRLLFGIDWHVIKRVENYRDFKSAYERILRYDELFSEEDISDFLGGNALTFLGLSKGERNRKRLKAFYEDHDMVTPSWWDLI